MTRLLFNSDDFGKNSRVNTAVLRAHREGVLDSASLMVTGEAFEEAVQMARSTPTLRVGLHLALSEARPALPAEQVPALLAKNGNLIANPALIGMKLAFCSRTQKQAAAEIAAQFQRFAETGLPRAHVDGHHHLHMHPFVFHQCVDWAERLGFRRIRIAREWGAPFPPRRDSRAFAAKLARHATFCLLAHAADRRLTHSKLEWCNGILGLWETGRVSEDYLLQALPRLPSGTWEVYLHVGAETPDEELEAMLSPRVKALLATPDRFQSLFAKSFL